VLAWLCVPGLLDFIFFFAEIASEPAAPTEVLGTNFAAAVVEMILLIIGALLLSHRRTAGRRIIAATGIVVALQGFSGSLQASLTGAQFATGSSQWTTVQVVAPLTAVLAVAAVVLALHPSTGRWCLPAGPGIPEPQTPQSTSYAKASGLLMTSGALVAVSVLLYGTGFFSFDVPLENWRTESWLWVVKVVAIGLLFATRQARWGGLLIGLVVWDLAWFQATWNNVFNLQTTSSYWYFAGMLVAMAGLVCALIALPPRWADKRAISSRLPGMVLFALPALLAVSMAIHLMRWIAYPQDRFGVVQALVIAAVLLVYGLAARCTPSVSPLGLGWVLGGVSLAAQETAYLAPIPVGISAALWIGLAITAATVYPVFRTRPTGW
jgi:hypothetical protein